MNLPQILIKFYEKFQKPRYRDRRAYYASSALSDLRDQYWEATGVPTTNPPDFKGSMTMAIGTWIERGLVSDVLKNLHFFGIHFVGEQIPVGGSNPGWDGYLDGLVCQREGEKFLTPVVIEIKTAHGYGADLLYRELEPKDGYVAQLGLYLKDLHEKGITKEGILLYVLLSDRNFGEVLAVKVRYDAATGEAVAYLGQRLDGTEQPLDYRVNLKTQVLERWQKLDAAVAEKKTPAPEYQYKRELTPEFLAEQTDTALKAAAAGEKILGDWQPRYSRYFNKILETDGTPREYTLEEIAVINKEIARRKPLKAAARKEKAAATRQRKANAALALAPEYDAEDESDE